MTLKNPHRKGSISHQNFASFCAWYANKSQSEMVEKHKSLKADSQNFARFNVAQMQQMDFEADAIEKIYAHRFGESLTTH